MLVLNTILSIIFGVLETFLSYLLININTSMRIPLCSLNNSSNICIDDIDIYKSWIIVSLVSKCIFIIIIIAYCILTKKYVTLINSILCYIVSSIVIILFHFIHLKVLYIYHKNDEKLFNLFWVVNSITFNIWCMVALCLFHHIHTLTSNNKK